VNDWGTLILAYAAVVVGSYIGILLLLQLAPPEAGHDRVQESTGPALPSERWYGAPLARFFGAVFFSPVIPALFIVFLGVCLETENEDA
jgi:hypothetical protein